MQAERGNGAVDGESCAGIYTGMVFEEWAEDGILRVRKGSMQ